jgi:hypothetical protein
MTNEAVFIQERCVRSILRMFLSLTCTDLEEVLYA